MTKKVNLPKDLNFAMPPEWVEHTCTFMEWPVQDAMCFPEDYEQVCAGYAQIAQAIAEFEPITMLVNAGDMEQASQLCGAKVKLVELEHNDAWMRDNGPTFVTNPQGDMIGVNWKFNAWGEKYAPFDLDDSVAPRLLDKLGVPSVDAPLVLEGGSIHVDGEGTLLTTEECLLNPNRNPHLSRTEIEEVVKKHLNVGKTIWLKRGLYGDETDGHIDNVACFARPGVIILQVCDDPLDPNFEITQENREILRKAIDAQGRKSEVVEIQQPKPAFFEGKRLTLSYLNFYFVNGGIILPMFGNESEERDQQAKETLQRLYPDRKIATVDGMAIIKEGGNVHCTTQQMPIRRSVQL